MKKIKRKQRLGFGLFGFRELSLLEGIMIMAFFPEAKQITIKKILERVDYSYERVNSALKSLHEKKIVEEKSIGKTLVYSLKLHDLASEIGFDHYMLEREIDFMKKYPIQYKLIKEIMENHSILMVILFGSYSKSTENKQSDLDLMCVPALDKKEVEKFILSLRHKYGIKIAPIIIPLAEFPNIKKDNKELWNDLRMYGIIFKGEDYFYSWMYKDDK